MKVIIMKNLYPKLWIVNENINYIENISITYVEWVQKNYTMHPPINVLINFNEFINKHKNLQNITFDGLLTNVIPIAPISRNFQYNHYIPKSNTSKNFNQ
jgi:hypothetical protein